MFRPALSPARSDFDQNAKRQARTQARAL